MTSSTLREDETPDSLPPTLPSPRPFVRITPPRVRTETEYHFVFDDPADAAPLSQ